ncbi:MAG: fibronectin type III domain-containing protein [Candidatus Latescibacteria bacterium]|nr:fibronectin type III domain-containing protein [Candidatus Latescibacterota bacterium]
MKTTTPLKTFIAVVLLLLPLWSASVTNAQAQRVATPTAPPPPKPRITAISPDSGPTTGGTPVTITGQNFQDGATVKIGGVSADSVKFISADSIKAITPPGTAGKEAVKVTNPDGQFDTLNNGFTYVAPPPPPAPLITAIIPNSGPTTGGTPVMITGQNFKAGATVTIGGAAATTVTVVSADTITALTPPGTAGERDVVVTNPDSQSAQLKKGFTYVKADEVAFSFRLRVRFAGAPQDTSVTVFTETRPAGQSFTIPALTASDPRLQPLYDALQGTRIDIPLRSISQSIGLDLTVHGATVQPDGQTAFAAVRGKPVFFFVTGTVSINDHPRDRFDFEDGFPIGLTLPLARFTRIMHASGVDSSAVDSLVFAYSTDKEFTQAGLVSQVVRVPDGLPSLVAALSHLSDLAGIAKGNLVVDTKPPTITDGPTADPADTSVVVTWITNELSTSRVAIGLAQNALQTASDDSGLVLLHSVAIGNLTRNTKYFYQVFSSDASGNEVSSNVRNFRTKAAPDTTAPRIIGRPRLLSRRSQDALIGWETDVLATSTVEFGLTKALGTVVSDPTLVREHAILLTSLTADTTYYYLASSTNAAGRTTAYRDTLTFKTPAVSQVAPLRIIVRPEERGITETSAIITWTTDRVSDSRVQYWVVGTTDTVETVNPDLSLARQHVVTLTDLTPGTHYAYIVISVDQSNDRVTGPRRTFRTRTTPDTQPPRLVQTPRLLYVGDEVAVFGWMTNEASDSFVYYQADGDSLFQSQGNSNFVRKHVVKVFGLRRGVGYTFRVTSTDPSGNTVVWPPGATIPTKRLTPSTTVQVPGSGGRFTTNPTPDTQTPIILAGPTIVAQTASTMTVSWETDEISDSVVQFGAGSTLDQEVSVSDLVTFHQMTLTGLNAATTYQYQVNSTDPIGNGPTPSGSLYTTTTSVTDADPPVIISGSLTASPSNNLAVIVWQTDELSDSVVEYGTVPDSLTETVDDPEPVTAHSITITPLEPNQQYYVRVLSTDLNGNGPTPSTTLTVTTSASPDTVPPVISGLTKTVTVGQDTTGTVTMRWNTDKLATGLLEIGARPDSLSVASIENTSGLTHTLSASRLLLNTRYYVRVGAVAATDTTGLRVGYSSMDSLLTPAVADTTLPDRPSGLMAIPGSGAVRLRWRRSTSTGVTGYNVYRNGTPLATGVSDTTLLDASAANGQTFTYRVRTVSTSGKESVPSDSAQALPSATSIPTAPAAISPASGDTVSLKPVLVISNATPVDTSRAVLTYEFVVAADSAFANSVIQASGVPQGTGNNPTHWEVSDPNLPSGIVLTDGTRYWWRVRADDGTFAGWWMPAATFIASAGQPTGVTLASFVADESRGVVTLRWSTANDHDLTGFHVERSVAQDGAYERITSVLITGTHGHYAFIDPIVQVNAAYYYRLEAVYRTGLRERFDPIAVRVTPPREFALHQNYPNPFNPETTIRFDLPALTAVTLRIYNLLGQEVATLLDGDPKPAGFYTIRWDGRDASGRPVASGLYVYRLEAGTFVKTRKMLLMR